MCKREMTLLHTYPFDISLNLEKNTFRFINLDKDPQITTTKQAAHLLKCFDQIVRNDMDCLSHKNLTIREITNVIRNKTNRIMCGLLISFRI